MRRFAIIIGLLGTSLAKASGQTPAPTQAQLEERIRAHAEDFGFLLGRWSFVAQTARHRTLRGTWTAVPLQPGVVLDEFRVTGDSGQDDDVSNSIRTYNPVRDQWEIVTVTQISGLKNVGTGSKVGEEIHIEQAFGANIGHTLLFRIRYYNIRTDAFSWSDDRSTDGGHTWDANWLRIEATRVAPAPERTPLAPDGRRP